MYAPNARSDIRKGLHEYGPEMLEKFGINTPLRFEHFMAQTAHESAGFRTTVEYASGEAYEGRKDLGNTHRGDGKRYRGRGLIQVTGRSNYKRFTKWVRETQPDAPDFEEEPELVSKFPWALLSAVWYWTAHDLNKLADEDGIVRITRIVNGGLNGLDSRRYWLKRAKEILGE